MRKIFFFLLCTALFAACSDDKTPDPTPTPIGDPFTIALSDITTSSVKIAITPASETQVYYYNVLDKAAFAKDHNSDAATYITSLLNDDKLWDAGMTTQEKVAKMTIAGKKTYEVKNLTVDTKYIVIAVGLAPDGTLSTKVITNEFTTTVYPFTIALSDITSSSVKITVTPASETLVYYYDVLQKADFAKHHNSNVATYITRLLNDDSQWDEGMTMTDRVNRMSTSGKGLYDAKKLAAETEHIVFAVGLNPDGTLSTEAVTAEFTTLVKEDTGLTFEVNVLQTEWDNIDFEVIPSNNEESYFYTIKSTAFCESMSDADLFTLVVDENSFMIPFMSKTGPSSEIRTPDGAPFNYYNPNTGYTLLVFGYDTNAYQTTTKLFKFEMRTATGEGNPAACTFDVTISDLKTSKMTVAIAASNPQLTYLWDLIDDATYQIYKNRFNDYVASYVVEIGGSAKIDEQCSVGDSGLPFSELSPSTTYYVWAICIDDHGIPTANVVLSEPIRTPDPAVSTATVTTAVKYFNGDEVAAQYSQYESSKGMAFVVMTFGHSENAAMWYGGLSEEDLSNPTTITDTQIINLLTDTKYIEDYWLPVTKLRNCNWNTPYTLFTVAKDKDENYSRVSRQVFTFTKAGAAPISEFVVPTAMSQVRMSSFLKPINKIQKATIKSYKPVAKKK